VARVRILVTNDDGVQAPGLLALAQEMRKLGKVTALPSPLQKLESESMARVLEVEFDGDGKHVVIPRANVEMIED